ncbi:uncharacterized protein LOC107641247 [Arachis ipaensis]|uniref:uncharacterized protein LOC107641247 n=1 Tax=Arachis ipaensis TaxID=130454 RepID=UPI0007AF25F1|nr:uncharacterized protein LOC107641247 [Arachis ipaensis]
MQTRSKSGIVKPKLFLTTTSSNLDLYNNVSTTTTQALQSPHWHQVMLEELQALYKNQTWSLETPPPTAKVIGSSWIYSIKRKPNGDIAKYKAKLVAKGNHQVEGVDYEQVFAPIIKPSSIRIVLTIALKYHWQIRQFDFNNAFLNGNLNEVVFMKQPPEFSQGDVG